MADTTPVVADLDGPTRLGDEITITGKWLPRDAGTRFRSSPDAPELRREWEDIHRAAASHEGILSTEINHAVGEDAVLVHHVFRDAASLVDYFATTADEHADALAAIARPDLQLVRGVRVTDDVRAAVEGTGVDVAFGEHLFGFVKHDHRLPDATTAVNVTARWGTRTGTRHELDELVRLWRQVATEAYGLEEGMLRFEAYRVLGEDALIIHEVFRDTAELRFHLTKGTAAMFKKELDEVAAPDRYFFRGPVSWSIRTYSRFMHLPATYSSRGSHHTRPGGSASDGLTTV